MEENLVAANKSWRLPELYVKVENNEELIRKKLRKNGNLLRKSFLSKGRRITEVNRDPPNYHLESLMNPDSNYIKQEKEYMAAIARLNHGSTFSSLKPEPGLPRANSSSSSSNPNSCPLYESFERANPSPPSSPCCTVKQEPPSPDCSVSETFFSETSNPDSDFLASSEHYSNSSSQTTDGSSTFSVLVNAVNSTSAKPLDKTSPNITIKQEPSDSDQDSSASQSKSSSSSSSSESKPQWSERVAFLRSEVLGNPMLQTLFNDLFELKRQYNNIDEQAVMNEVKAMKKRNKLLL
ncbi:secreted protein PRY1-like [Dendroctonus ponderosae]|uniref:Uncharacterized protein n=1 Tax=Dendroctonus ponderosae TaxID=77166 RepID=A0AAR5Q7V8_DENPD|nr:secreted protein PRY1-like [Dendroctonus ponderosae]KAH1008088.1 hypothetical protein HUJ04_005232 [Dendroctonus ponderosae]KAH1015579.1 hypothetical protein HUJ05_013280 [Dendroctonus ponderosae]